MDYKAKALSKLYQKTNSKRVVILASILGLLIFTQLFLEVFVYPHII